MMSVRINDLTLGSEYTYTLSADLKDAQMIYIDFEYHTDFQSRPFHVRFNRSYLITDEEGNYLMDEILYGEVKE
jgi:hypothetical protein